MTQSDIIRKNIQAQIDGIDLLPICLMGDSGIGKSKTIESIANDMNIGLSTISFSSIGLEDLMGIPTFATDTSLDIYSRSESSNVQSTLWTIPSVIAHTNRIAEKYGSCIMHCEDIHVCDKVTSNVLYQLLLDRSIGDYNLHPKVSIVLSMNIGKQSDAGTMSAAIKSRLNLTEYRFDFNVWYTNFGRFLHPLVSSFLKTNQQYISESESRNLEASASARTWSKISQEFDLYTNDELNRAHEQLLHGAVSPAAVNSFNKHVLIYNKLDFRSMINSKSIPDLSIINELDQVLYGMLFHEVQSASEGVYIIDLLNNVQAQSNADTIIGFLSAEIATKYQSQLDGNSITDGQSLVINALIGSLNPADFDLTKKQIIQLSTEPFNQRTALLTIVSTYLNH